MDVLSPDRPPRAAAAAAAAAAARPFVSVVVPHYNDLAGLEQCHACLVAQTWPASCFEIIVADNNSSCGLDSVRQVARSAVVVTASEQGAGPARNAGVAASRGAIIAFIDSDCLAKPEWLAEGVLSLGRFDFTGGRVAVFAQDAHRPTPVEAFEIVFNFDFRRYIEKVGFTGTGNMFVTRHVFDQVGGFRAGVSEDVDWSWRARGAGYRLGYAPGAVVRHPARRQWEALEHRWARLTTETFALACESSRGRGVFLIRGLLMPVSILPHAARILFSPRLHGVAPRVGALAILCRLRLWRARRMVTLVARRPLPSSPAKPQRPGWTL